MICHFKNHFLSILAGVDAAFPPYLWDLLLTQAELTIKLLRQATANPKISAWEYFNGPFNFYKTPLAPMGSGYLSMPNLALAGYGTTELSKVSTWAQHSTTTGVMS